MSKQTNTTEYQVTDHLSTVGEKRDMRQVRCPKCKQLAATSLNKGGSSVLRCQFCGTEYSCTRM